MRTVGKLLWALDAFHGKPKVQLRVLDTVRRLWGNAPPVIQPVAMLPLGKYDAKHSRFLEDWEDVAEVARENVDALLRGIDVPTLRPTRFERATADSPATAARGLLGVAFDEGADMIAVSSHARRGLARFLAGSFAESLAAQSPMPVLVVTPRNGRGEKIRTVLFETDFSPASLGVYEAVVQLTAALGARLRLFHKIPAYYPGVAYPLFVMPLPPPESPATVRARVRASARKWLDYARAHRIRVTFHLDTKPGNDLEGLLTLARRSSDDTVIATGPRAPLLRLSPCPVIVVHEHQENARRPKPRHVSGGDFEVIASRI